MQLPRRCLQFKKGVRKTQRSEGYLSSAQLVVHVHPLAAVVEALPLPQ